MARTHTVEDRVLRSMTGFGAARRQGDDLDVAVEIRSVNGRFLKTSLKAPPMLSAREADMEALVRGRLRRGSVTVTVYLRRTDPASLVAVNDDVVAAYRDAFHRLGLKEDSIPLLKGVVGQNEPEQLSDAHWEVVESATLDAVADLVARREHEGAALTDVIRDLLQRVEELAQSVRDRSPQVVEEHFLKLQERLRILLGEVPVDEQVVAREAAVLADRGDVTEEVDRLAAHVAHARELLTGNEAAGRTLDFIAQEMLREANTIGSKSNDAQLARLVIDLKSAIEQLKEQVANIE
jgi:uncharacterized protein (TIGR00255 family)